MDSRATGGKKIGILVHYPFQYYVHKNVYRALVRKGEDVEFIIDPTAYYPTKPKDETLKSLRTLLTQQGVNFVEFLFDDTLSRSAIQKFENRYSVLISTWHWGVISKVRGPKKVFITYGAGKELTTFGFWKRFFDLCLAYGDYDHYFFSQLSQSEVVGNPKFDDWFAGTFDKKVSEKARSLLDPAKITVLYLPTHSDLCSIQNLALELKRVTKSFNVLVKLHYYNRPEDPESVALLSHPDIHVFEDSVDLLSLLAVSDVVLSDNSSAIFDAMLADKPIVVTDFLPKQYFDTEHRKKRIYRRGAASALTYSNSIEQRIKRDGTVVVIDKPEKMSDALKLAHEDPLEIREKRRLLTNQLFAYKDSHCAERAAQAIIECARTDILPEKPFLCHAINYFAADLLRSRRDLLVGYIEGGSLNDSTKETLQKMSCCIVVYGVNESVDHIVNTALSVSSLPHDCLVVSSCIGEVQTKLETLTDVADQKINFTDPHMFGEIVSKLARAYRRIVCIYAGCEFYESEINRTLFTQVVNDSSIYLACGYVSSIAQKKKSDERLMEMELARRAGFKDTGAPFTVDCYFRMEFGSWNSPVDEPRFFLLDSTHFMKNLLKYEMVQTPYQLLLHYKRFLVFNTLPMVTVSIQICDRVCRSQLVRHKLLERLYMDKMLGLSNLDVIKQKIRLVEDTFSFSYGDISLAPKALFNVMLTLLILVRLDILRFLKSDH